jgi:hypothetical protein
VLLLAFTRAGISLEFCLGLIVISDELHLYPLVFIISFTRFDVINVVFR